MLRNRSDAHLPAVLILTSALASCGSSADASGLSMGLVRDEVSLHEPVVVEVTFLNAIDQGVHIDFGVAEVEELDFEIVPRDEGSVERIAPTLGPKEWHTGGLIKVQPGAVYRSRVLLNRWLAINSPGAYEVVAEFTGTVTREDATAVAVQRRFVLPLRVQPRDPQRLVELADDLARTACQGHDLGAAYDAAKTLATIKDAVVVPSLAKLLDCGYTEQGIAVGALGEIGGPEAIAALLTAAEGDDAALADLARIGLRTQVQQHGSEIPADLRRRIEEAISRGASEADDSARAEPGDQP